MHRGTNNEPTKEGKGNAYRTKKKQIKMNYLSLVPATILPKPRIICLNLPKTRLFSVTNFKKI